MYKTILRFEKKEDGVFLRYPDKTKKFCIESELKKCEDFCTVTFQKVYKSRTNQQNRMFWGIVQQIAFETGNDLEDVEEAVKERAVKRGYPMKVNNLTGKPKPESMTKVDTVEMGYLLEEVMQLASELGIVVDTSE